MRFSKVLGKGNPQIIKEAEERLSSTILELSMAYSLKAFGSKIGGDIFLYQLLASLQHIADVRADEFDEELKILEQENYEEYLKKLPLKYKLLRTCATNGIQYFWVPKFINTLSPLGLRLIVAHEGFHCIYMHPSRRGSRNPEGWNLAVDFKVNFSLLEDLKNRGISNNIEKFKEALGDFITLEEYIQFIKNPFNPPTKLELWNPTYTLRQQLNPDLYKSKENKSLFYAEPNLPKELMQPEAIYNYFVSQIPKCSCCGKLGVYKKTEEYKDLEQQISKEFNIKPPTSNSIQIKNV